jgi:plasmid stabilization system protein ParE
VLKLQIHPNAEHDLFNDAAWYDDRDPGLGDSFIKEVRVALAKVLDAPERYPLHPHVRPQRTPPVRRYVVPGFPYTVAYQVFEDRIRVLAIAHAKRHPRYWSDRR